MSANLEQAILEKVQALPDEKQREVLALVEELLKEQQEPPPHGAVRPIWEIIVELSSQIPLEEWAKLPADGAEQHDHYLYGSPKRTNPKDS
jgi:hypothetical protein